MHSFTDRNSFPLKPGANMPPANHVIPRTKAATYGQDYSHMYPRACPPSNSFPMRQTYIMPLATCPIIIMCKSLSNTVHFCCAHDQNKSSTKQASCTPKVNTQSMGPGPAVSCRDGASPTSTACVVAQVTVGLRQTQSRAAITRQLLQCTPKKTNSF